MSPSPEETNALIERVIAESGIEIPDQPHARRCAVFAGEIFDALHERLQLAPADRPLAVIAALLHDVGYLRGGRDHHRKSFDVIRTADIPDISADDRLIVACAARYHGRSLPNIEHAGFGSMSAEDQRRVRRLSGVVRLAVALDASHLGLVTRISVTVERDHVTLIAHASSEPAVERDRLRENAGAFAELTYLPARTEIVVEH